MNIIKIDPSNKNNIKKFINFPFQLYKSNKYWVPPFQSELYGLLRKKNHPFFIHSTGDFFIAEENNEVLGRIAVLKNVNFCKHHDKQIAFIYYFDSVNDKNISSKLFSTAQEWAKNSGATELYGPRGFSRSSGVGTLVEGFNFYPAIGIPYNYDYYDDLIKSYGFNKVTDYYSGFMKNSQELPEKLYLVADKVKKRGHFWIKTFTTKNELKSYISLVNEVHHTAFKDNPGYYPSTDEEFNMMAKTMIQAADPRLLKLIMKDDEVAGFIISYADISMAIQRTKGKMWPLGWVDLLLEKNRTKIVNMNGLGLLPKYQGLGSNALLYTEVEKTIRDFGFEHAEIVQVDERNFKSKSDSDVLGVIWHKKHRTYNMAI